jgi:hyperosmotically inducible protein
MARACFGCSGQRCRKAGRFLTDRVANRLSRSSNACARRLAERRQALVKQFSKESFMHDIKRYLSAAFLAVALAGAVGCAATSKQEGTGEYVDDSVITTKVKAAILNEATLKVAEINVETFKGVVQLSGFVNSAADITKAIEVARAVGGVKSVKNDMRLK